MNQNEWKKRNELLQETYREYLLASKQRDKDAILSKIQQHLKWEPFENLCNQHSACISGIIRYGLDSITEHCIGIIDKIANGEECKNSVY